MNDQEQARAQQLWESLKCDEDPVPDIAAALVQARAEGRREGLREGQAREREMIAVIACLRRKEQP